jgi:hypothetical protein
MSQEKTESQPRLCPSCGKQLAPAGDLLRCEEHGEFFSYGPRLLVRVSHEEVSAPLMPWQTLRDKVVG